MLDTFTKSSVDSLLKRVLSLASRPLAEFNKYEALDLTDALKNAAHDTKHPKEGYYRLVFETLRAKLDQPAVQFRNPILPLLGDKDHERVLDMVAKVEKNNQRQMAKKPSSSPDGATRKRPDQEARCFYCNKTGHFRFNCYKRKKELAEAEGNQKFPRTNK
jgi:hypothetical protein